MTTPADRAAAITPFDGSHDGNAARGSLFARIVCAVFGHTGKLIDFTQGGGSFRDEPCRRCGR